MAASTSSEHDRWSEPGSRRHRLAGVRVLLVEDHDDLREVYGHVLASAGAQVTSAASGDEASNALRSADVIVTDVAMPGRDGISLLEEVRGQSRDVPVIAVTGYVKEQLPRLANAPFDLVLLKPVDPWRLCDEVEKVLSGRRAAA
jgi:CheY-like chemotaxis protein